MIQGVVGCCDVTNARIVPDHKKKKRKAIKQRFTFILDLLSVHKLKVLSVWKNETEEAIMWPDTCRPLYPADTRSHLKVPLAPGKDIPEATSFEGIPGKPCWGGSTWEQSSYRPAAGTVSPSRHWSDMPFNLTPVITKIMHVWLFPSG